MQKLTMKEAKVLHEYLDATARRFCVMYAGKEDREYSVYGDGLTFIEALDKLVADNRVGSHVIYDNYKLQPVAMVKAYEN